MSKGWYGFDLDGTLAYYNGWQGIEHIGHPIGPVTRRLRYLLECGETCKIVTARVANPEDREAATAAIQAWTLKHFGVKLEVTNAKDFGMIEMYDDRCKQVVPNQGILVEKLAKNMPIIKVRLIKPVKNVRGDTWSHGLEDGAINLSEISSVSLHNKHLEGLYPQLEEAKAQQLEVTMRNGEKLLVGGQLHDFLFGQCQSDED